MSAVATAGAAAWVVPEILTAKPAVGATLSNGPGGGGGGGGGTTTGVVTSPATTSPSGTSLSTPAVETAASTTAPATTLANTGTDLQRDVAIGGALVAGGWALQHWASRTPKVAEQAADGPSDAEEPGARH
jgi:hypothetical protein